MSSAHSRSLFRRQARAFVVSWAGALASGCIPGAGKDHDAIMALNRGAVADNGGRTVTYFQAGEVDAPRIIYVHGTPGDATSLGRYLITPIENHESFAIDRPGFGSSLRGGSVTSYAEQAAAIEPLLTERGGQYPILVGHSLGGPIVAQAAVDYPDRVGALVILAGSLDPNLEDPKWFNCLADTGVGKLVLPKMLKNSNDEMLAAEKQTHLLSERLSEIRCPVWIVHGTDDGLVPYANVQFIEIALTSSVSVRTLTLEGADHFIPWTHEQKIREVLQAAASYLRAEPAGRSAGR